MKKQLKSLDANKKYNMIVLNPANKDVKNMTYLLTIETSMKYSGQLPQRLQGFVNKASFSYQIDVGLCKPTSFFDSSEEQIAFGNSTEFVYWINNGTSTYKSPFDKIIAFMPFCGDDYILNQTIDYSYVHNESMAQVDE